ncbi:hypothetical protein MIU24_30495 [Streptomyces venezuelae]
MRKAVPGGGTSEAVPRRAMSSSPARSAACMRSVVSSVSATSTAGWSWWKSARKAAMSKNLHRMTDRVARRDAGAHSPAELSAFLRDNADHRWTPPVGGAAGALGHDVVHGLDVTVALGLDRRVPEDRLRVLLDQVRPAGLRFFGVDLGGVRLCADDLDWSYGSGAPVTGSAQDLLLLAYGRRLPEGRLHGERSGRFTLAEGR